MRRVRRAFRRSARRSLQYSAAPSERNPAHSFRASARRRHQSRDQNTVPDHQMDGGSSTPAWCPRQAKAHRALAAIIAFCQKANDVCAPRLLNAASSVHPFREFRFSFRKACFRCFLGRKHRMEFAKLVRGQRQCHMRSVCMWHCARSCTAKMRAREIRYAAASSFCSDCSSARAARAFAGRSRNRYIPPNTIAEKIAPKPTSETSHSTVCCGVNNEPIR